MSDFTEYLKDKMKKVKMDEEEFDTDIESGKKVNQK